MNLRIRWTVFGIVVGCFLSAIAFLAYRALGTFGSGTNRTLDAPVVVRQIQGLNELVSVKYTVQKVVGIEEKKVPLGSEKLLLFVDADVLAGVDLSMLVPADVRVLSGRRVQIALPPPKIIHIIIDDKQTKVWDRRITWWTPWVPYNPDLERQARLTARGEIEQAALEMGILNQARRNAEMSIQSLLNAMGVKAVTVNIS